MVRFLTLMLAGSLGVMAAFGFAADLVLAGGYAGIPTDLRVLIGLAIGLAVSVGFEIAVYMARIAERQRA